MMTKSKTVDWSDTHLAAVNTRAVGRLFFETNIGLWCLWPALVYAANWQLDNGWQNVKYRMAYVHGAR